MTANRLDKNDRTPERLGADLEAPASNSGAAAK
jgi:hypothetical protein